MYCGWCVMSCTYILICQWQRLTIVKKLILNMMRWILKIKFVNISNNKCQYHQHIGLTRNIEAQYPERNAKAMN